MEEKKKAIFRRLTKLEQDIKEAYQAGNAKKLYLAETEHHVLSVFYEAIGHALEEDPNVTTLSLSINKETLEKLPHSVKMSVLCLTEGVCAIDEKDNI